MQDLRRRASELRIRGRSKMKRRELEEAISIVENENWYKENVQCKDCLREQFRQKKIDEEMYHKQLMKQAIRDLWRWCGCGDLIYGADVFPICRKCGYLHQQENSTEVDFSHQRVRLK